jgi:hypothetical protein
MLIADSENRKTPEKIYGHRRIYVNNKKALDFTGHPKVLKFLHNYTTKKKHSVVNKRIQLQLKKKNLFKISLKTIFLHMVTIKETNLLKFYIFDDGKMQEKMN